MPALILKPGREKSLIKHHPWVYSGAVASLSDLAEEPGATVEILDCQGRFLAWGSYNARSQIISRVWSWNPEEKIDEEFLFRRLKKSIEARQNLCSFYLNSSGIRLVHGESDGLPGLIVDQYADVLVVQFLAAGVEYWREVICDILMELTRPNSLYERSDVDVRKLEGLDLRTGLLRGKLPSATVKIAENDIFYEVDIFNGHKTGFYLDQRSNRLKIRKLAAGKEVLDCFCYTGGFGLNAVKGGARSVLLIDSSQEVLSLAQANFRLNQLESHFQCLEGDVFQYLRYFRDRGDQFDLIILDPPKFARSASMVERASRGYKDINLLSFKLLRPGGYLVTFSCSGGISEELFQKIVAGAALDAGVEAQIVERLHQDFDHPVSLYFPEGAYLKGFIIQVG